MGSHRAGPSTRPADGRDVGKLRLRGRTRGLQLVLGLVFGLTVVGMGIGAAFAPDGGWLVGVGGVAIGGFFVVIGVRGARRGMDADQHGILVRNMFTSRWVPWESLRDIGFEVVPNDAGGTAYHRLLLDTTHGSVVTQAPGGSDEPGGRLDLVRTALLRMRDQAIADGP